MTKSLILILMVLFFLIPVKTSFDVLNHPVSQTISLDPNDVRCLAYNVMYEAAGESDDGKSAVAWVTVNRTHDSKFSKNICTNILSPNQFSWTNEKRKIVAFNNFWILNEFKSSWENSVKIAEEVLRHQIKDPTKGAIYYVRSDVHVIWMRKMSKTSVIGNHVFMRPKYIATR